MLSVLVKGTPREARQAAHARGIAGVQVLSVKRRQTEKCGTVLGVSDSWLGEVTRWSLEYPVRSEVSGLPVGSCLWYGSLDNDK